MLPNLESKMTEYLDKAPLPAKLYFSYEIATMRESLEESQRLKEAYEPTAIWYVEYGQNFNEGFNGLYNAVDRSYATYDALASIPIIGEQVCAMIDRYIGGMFVKSVPQQLMDFMPASGNSFKLPSRETAMHTLDSIYTLGVEAICAHYEATTGNPSSEIRSQIPQQPELYDKDPSQFRDAVINTLESIGTLFGEMFGTATTYGAAGS